MVDDFWSSAQKLLADPNFVASLKSYDKDNVQPKVCVYKCVYICIHIDKFMYIYTFYVFVRPALLHM